MKSNPLKKAYLLVLLYGLSAVAFAAPQTVQFTVQGVLGTSADITLGGVTQQEAKQQVSLALDEIKRLEMLLSNYQNDSELSQLNRGDFTGKLSAELQQILTLCELWQARSSNAFSCKLGAAQSLWKNAQKSQILPDRKALRSLARAARKAKFSVNLPIENWQTIPQPTIVNFDINGLAKGYIIDHAFAYLKASLPTLTSLSIDIGGDGRYWQQQQKPFTIGISQPFKPHDNATIAQIKVINQAIAASGFGSRHYLIKQQKFHHILNPRDAWPLNNAPGAIVIAPDATTADAIATALNAKPMQAGIDWVNQLDNVEALVISEQGFQLASNRWHHYQLPATTAADKHTQLNIPRFSFDFTIPTLDVDDYEKPYVAVWITNAERKVVKNLLMLGKSEQWAQTNKRWWRKSGRHHELLLDGLARPSRKPGHYQLSWDWRDDYGNKVAMGEYQLHIEVSREDGAATLANFSFNSTELPFKQTKPAQGEIGPLQLNIHAIR
ncbi:DUF2271 domain-containing protein [Colwellia sp. D2M02]|uniref:DUF2271 domain-containing protein n=1 Tax=Colwellia sp. D2M02 TaxID=2841562 RepID=UPI001C09E637|nr:DUF2271 domain-containing protein [Colwellia sp. D2M02]MBU2891828.1 DUF2271 domain-containing protein [Colwellia sp. D2M02]